MKRVIVFDIDGTLAQTAVYWIPVLEETNKRIFQKFGLSNAILKSEDALKMLGKPDAEIYGTMFPGQSPEQLNRLMIFANQVWKELLPNFPYRLFEGALETVEALHKKGYEIYLSSNCDLQYLETLPEQTGLHFFLTNAVCAEQFPGMEKWEFTRAMLSPVGDYEGYFIGDSRHDMVAGRKNNLTSVYAAYGYAIEPEPELIDLRIQDIRELVSIL